MARVCGAYSQAGKQGGGHVVLRVLFAFVWFFVFSQLSKLSCYVNDDDHDGAYINSTSEC